MAWTVYVVRCADGSFYTGIARDAARRVLTHNLGRGAAYTRPRRPVELVYTESAQDRGAALRREWAMKQLSRREKEALIMGRQPTAVGQGPSGFRGFRPAALRFFRNLKRNNTRAWFEANRPVYELEVKAPLQQLVEELDVVLARVAPEIVGDPRRSVFRIHRDVRFSKDKSPYKTHAACWFYHADAGRGVGGEAQGGAGFYFHLAPGECMLGAGIWMPPRPSLDRIRDSLAADPDRFAAIVRAPRFRRRFGVLDNDAMLKRLPRGFADDHPAAPWLRYQSFTAGRALSEREALSAGLARTLARSYAELTPFVRWLNHALGLRTMERRLP
jgi:uncharacterized protein (TIGR02453 family)